MNTINDPTALPTYAEILNIFANIDRPRNGSGAKDASKDINVSVDEASPDGSLPDALPEGPAMASKSTECLWEQQFVEEVRQAAPVFEDDESHEQLPSYEDLLLIFNKSGDKQAHVQEEVKEGTSGEQDVIQDSSRERLLANEDLDSGGDLYGSGTQALVDKAVKSAIESANQLIADVVGSVPLPADEFDSFEEESPEDTGYQTIPLDTHITEQDVPTMFTKETFAQSDSDKRKTWGDAGFAEQKV